jgi:hypothetical protein
MRQLLSLVTLLCIASATSAQAPVKIEAVRVGFPSYTADDVSRFKVGLWTPVHVRVEAGPEGLPASRLVIETPDSEDVGTLLSVPIPQLPKGKKHTVLAYAKPGNLSGNFKIKIRVGNDDDTVSYAPFTTRPLDIGGRLYLTLGKKIPDLHEGLRTLAPRAVGEQDPNSTWPRFAAHEDDVALLPERGLVYEAVDLIILSTANDKFLTSLQSDSARIKALSHWVRQGGRLIVSVSPRNQELVHALFASGAWHPPLPAVPPKTRRPSKLPDETTEQLTRVESFAGVLDRPFRIKRGELADLGDHRTWDVFADTAGDNRPLVARMPYGLGSITFLAFDLTEKPFTDWSGRKLFVAGMLKALEPPAPLVDRNDARASDLTTQLQRTLDTFDVPVISFGWVALFIIVYIIIVGPLDYLLLKKVFKRLEWTWITFPVVVLLVSGIAYFTAYALKGKDQKINVVEVVDFDLRTDLDANHQTRRAFAYGNVWFTLMSPQIRNYTIGVEPNMAAWGLAAPAKTPPEAEQVSWLGRPEFDGFGSYGRARSGFLRRPYEFAPDAAGLTRVPIPVWTSKSFTASWWMELNKLPFEAQLVYYPGSRNLKVSGTLKSNLPMDLGDAWLMYRDRVYEIGTLPGGGKVIPISLTLAREQPLQRWAERDARGADALNPDFGRDAATAFYDPTRLIKEILFQEKVDVGANNRNHAVRHLDLSWRLREDEEGHGGVREVILFGRVARQRGAAEALTASTDAPPAGALWIGAIPGGKEDRRPTLEGTMVQDTYVRAIIPARAKN